MKTVPNENIIKLRELADEMCVAEYSDNYKQIVLRLKMIMEEGKSSISNSKSSKNKVKCYEEMCIKVTSILNNIKIERNDGRE